MNQLTLFAILAVLLLPFLAVLLIGTRKVMEANNIDYWSAVREVRSRFQRFRGKNPSIVIPPSARVLILVGMWGPVIFLAALCLWLANR